MRTLSRFQTILFCGGGILMLFGAALRIFDQTVSLWLYAVGTLLFCMMQLKAEYLGRDFTLKRLRRQQLFSCACFFLTAVCMSMQTYHYGFATGNEWVLPLVVGAILQLYAAWRIPQELENAKKS